MGWFDNTVLNFQDGNESFPRFFFLTIRLLDHGSVRNRSTVAEQGHCQDRQDQSGSLEEIEGFFVNQDPNANGGCQDRDGGVNSIIDRTEA